MFRKLTNFVSTKIKSFFIVCFMLFSVFIFSGCVDFNYLEYSTDNAYYVDLYITLDEESQPYKKTFLKDIDNFLYNERLYYIELFKQKLNTCVVEDKLTTKEYETLLNCVLNNSSFETEDIGFNVQYRLADSSSYLFELAFTALKIDDKIFTYENLISIYTYTGSSSTTPDDNEDSKMQEEDSFLYKTFKQKLSSPYSSSDCEEIGNYVLNSDDYKYSEKGYTLNDADYYYTIITTSNKLKSDSDSVKNTDGIYYHTWEIDKDENGVVKQEDCTYYYTTLNTINWYILGLILTFVGLIVTTIVCYTKHKKRQKEILESIKINE